MVDTARIAELLRPFLTDKPAHSQTVESALLSPAQLHDILTYIDILLHWNARINLTAVRQPEEIVTRHFGESLFAASCLFPSSKQSANDQRPKANDLLDLGSGAGFPGLPIKIWLPQLRVTLVESNQRKAVFLREVVRALRLTDIDILASRAEEAKLRPDVVTLRAVERFDSILPIARRLVAPGGRLALLVGAAQVDRAHRLLPDLRWLDPVAIPRSSARVLVVGWNQDS